MAMVVPLLLAAQRQVDRNTSLWVTHLGDHRVSERWSVHTEAHVRRADLGGTPQQLLLRPAVNFQLAPDVLLTAGYSYYINDRYGGYPIPARNWEHHAFQQMQFTGRTGRVALQHRYRMEERFIATLVPDPATAGAYRSDRYTYRPRFRARLMATVPLGRRSLGEPGTWSASLYDELFLSFGDSGQPDLMQQNRLSALLGRQLTGQAGLQVGYLLQTIQRPGAAAGADLQEMNSTLHVILTWNLDLRRTEHPGVGGASAAG